MRYLIDRDKAIELINNLGNSVVDDKSADFQSGYASAIDDVIKLLLVLKL